MPHCFDITVSFRSRAPPLGFPCATPAYGGGGMVFFLHPTREGPCRAPQPGKYPFTGNSCLFFLFSFIVPPGGSMPHRFDITASFRSRALPVGFSICHPRLRRGWHGFLSLPYPGGSMPSAAARKVSVQGKRLLVFLFSFIAPSGRLHAALFRYHGKFPLKGAAGRIFHMPPPPTAGVAWFSFFAPPGRFNTASSRCPGR